MSTVRYFGAMKPKTALLHIGTPKTGTTSIQAYLFRAEMTGALQPYTYPLFHQDQNHNRLTTLYLGHGDQPGPRRVEFPHDDTRYQRSCRRYRQFLFQALQSSEGSILSGEVLANRFAPSTILRFRRDLESVGFEQFHIVLYIRDPADFYLSRTQSALTLPATLHPVVADPSSFRYEFRRIIENWEQAFPSQVIVRRYPRESQKDVIDDFSGVLERCLGINVPPASVRLNTTVSAEAMTIMQDHRESVGLETDRPGIPGLGQLARFLVSQQARLPQTKPKLKVALAEMIRANHREDAEWIKTRYGVDLELNHSVEADPITMRPHWRVEDIVESVDPDIVQRLRDEYRRIGWRLQMQDVVRRACSPIVRVLRNAMSHPQR